MSCDIHAFPERLENGRWTRVPEAEKEFDFQSYRVFGWLAGVRNYSAVEPIAQSRGLPDGVAPITAEWYRGDSAFAHSASWVSLDELEAVDYDVVIEDRRCVRQTGPHSSRGGMTCAPGDGTRIRLGDFLGSWFVEIIPRLRSMGVDRVVFWFHH